VIASIFGTLGFAEEEFWSSCLKLFVVVMFVIIGMCVISSILQLSHSINRTPVFLSPVADLRAVNTTTTSGVNSGATLVHLPMVSRVSVLFSSPVSAECLLRRYSYNLISRFLFLRDGACRFGCLGDSQS
jgi:hypothetical protein